MTSNGNYCLTGDDATQGCQICGARGLGFCSLLDGAALSYLREYAVAELMARRRTLCREDEPFDRIHIIHRGVVKLFKLLPDGRRQITGFLGPGDILGSPKLMSASHCSAQTVTEVLTCSFTAEVFTDFLRRFPEVAMTLLFAATDEIEASHDHAILLGCHNAREKLAALLLILNHRWNSDSRPPDELFLPMTRSDLAEYLGLSVETVSRTFSAFKAEGLIATPRSGVVTLRNRPALLRMIGFDDVPVRNVAIGL